MKKIDAIAGFIRECSKTGELLTLVDIEAAIAGQAISISEPATEPVQFPALVQEAISSNDDIETIMDDSGCHWYFSKRFLTGAYARVVLLKGKGALKMMAEVIRQHSCVYPRPVPLALFQCPPFNLSNDDVSLCLKEMMAKPSSYRDIAHVTTSMGNLFAYSTDHLDPDYAVMLAEWADVGQIENP